MALYIIDCVYMCLSGETLKAGGPFLLVSISGEIKYPTSMHWECVTCHGHHILAKRRIPLQTTPLIPKIWAVWNINN